MLLVISPAKNLDETSELPKVKASQPALLDEASVLIEQLKPGGKLVVPVGETKQIMTCLTKHPDGSTTIDEFGDFAFVPLLKGTATD